MIDRQKSFHRKWNASWRNVRMKNETLFLHLPPFLSQPFSHFFQNFFAIMLVNSHSHKITPLYQMFLRFLNWNIVQGVRYLHHSHSTHWIYALFKQLCTRQVVIIIDHSTLLHTFRMCFVQFYKKFELTRGSTFKRSIFPSSYRKHHQAKWRFTINWK